MQVSPFWTTVKKTEVDYYPARRTYISEIRQGGAGCGGGDPRGTVGVRERAPTDLRDGSAGLSAATNQQFV
jgi:hypothetical protein